MLMQQCICIYIYIHSNTKWRIVSHFGESACRFIVTKLANLFSFSPSPKTWDFHFSSSVFACSTLVVVVVVGCNGCRFINVHLLRSQHIWALETAWQTISPHDIWVKPEVHRQQLRHPTKRHPDRRWHLSMWECINLAGTSRISI